MPTINLPSGDIIISSQPYSRESAEHILEELTAPGHDFTGYIKIVSIDKLYLLFFFQNRPYAAAKSIGHNISSLSLRDFFTTVGDLDSSNTLLSIHSTDPVLLKSLLVFFQNRPAVSAPVYQVRLEEVSRQILKESADALIVLKKHKDISFFFYKNGVPCSCHSSDTTFKFSDDLSIEARLLEYAAQPEEMIRAYIFRNISTSEDSESLVLSQTEMLRLLQGAGDKAGAVSNLALKVLDGAHKGELLTGPIPCVLGRKDTDIVIQDPLASKRHAAIQLVNGTLFLMDLHSTNGTFVNGIRIKKHKIELGDIIMLGETTFSVEKLIQPP
jgi:hypothetical protein